MIRIIIVIDERETNILVSNALEISLISYANRMQISTFLPYARTGVKKKKEKKKRICAQLSSSSRYLYVRYAIRTRISGVMVGRSIHGYIVHTCH